MQSKLTTRRFISDLNNIKGMAKAIPFVLAHPFKIDPYRKFFRNRSVFFGPWADLSLGDDGHKKLSEVCRAFAPCLQTNLMYQ